MNDIISTFLEIIEKLIPSKDLSTKDWLIRNSFYVITISACLFGAINLLKDTEFLKQKGLVKIANTPSRSLFEITYRRRNIVSSMLRFKTTYSEVYALFLCSIYNNKTLSFDYKNDENNNRLLITNSLIRKNIYSHNFSYLETEFNNNLEKLRKTFTNYDGCTFNNITSENFKAIERGFGKGFDSNRVAICSIQSENKNIIYLVVFYNDKDPQTNLFFNSELNTLVDDLRKIILDPTYSHFT